MYYIFKETTFLTFVFQNRKYFIELKYINADFKNDTLKCIFHRVSVTLTKSIMRQKNVFRKKLRKYEFLRLKKYATIPLICYASELKDFLL